MEQCRGWGIGQTGVGSLLRRIVVRRKGDGRPRCGFGLELLRANRHGQRHRITKAFLKFMFILRIGNEHNRGRGFESPCGAGLCNCVGGCAACSRLVAVFGACWMRGVRWEAASGNYWFVVAKRPIPARGARWRRVRCVDAVYPACG